MAHDENGGSKMLPPAWLSQLQGEAPTLTVRAPDLKAYDSLLSQSANRAGTQEIH